MADLDESDAAWREAFRRSAQPGDPTGVADAIRTRLAAGDQGTVVAGSTVPGWGARSALSLLPWLALAVVAGVVGALIGGAGGSGAGDPTVPGTWTISAPHSLEVRSCAEGPATGMLPAGSRVLAVRRSADSLWAGVRDPRHPESTVWLLASALTLDPGVPPLTELPIGGACPTVAAAPTAEPTPVEPPAPPDPGLAPVPQPDPVPVPPADTTGPTIHQLAVDVNGCPALVQVLATDDVAVAQVALTWSGAATGSAQMSLVSGTWRYAYDSAHAPEGSMTFRAVASDAAGNPSAPVVQNVYMVCLI